MQIGAKPACRNRKSQKSEWGIRAVTITHYRDSAAQRPLSAAGAATIQNGACFEIAQLMPDRDASQRSWRLGTHAGYSQGSQG
jgi:hypothetical protein